MLDCPRLMAMWLPFAGHRHGQCSYSGCNAVAWLVCGRWPVCSLCLKLRCFEVITLNKTYGSFTGFGISKLDNSTLTIFNTDYLTSGIIHPEKKDIARTLHVIVLELHLLWHLFMLQADRLFMVIFALLLWNTTSYGISVRKPLGPLHIVLRNKVSTY